MSKEEELHIVTEVGTFGNLNIEDPSKKKLKRDDKSVDELIREANEQNLNNA